MTTTVVERWGSLSATGTATEATFGTPVLPTGFFPMTGDELQLDPGLFSPHVMFGQKDLNTFPLYGQYKMQGAIAGPAWPTNGANLISAAIGTDAQAGYGVIGTTGTGSTTLSGASSAGATTISVTSASGFATSQIIQVDVNNTATPTTAECRKITLISGTTLTLDVALTYAHASSAPVKGVTSLYTHAVQQSNQLPSLTVEKNLGGYDSLQFAGARINKLGLSIPTSNQEATISSDLMAKSVAILDSPSTINVINESPWVFAEVTVALFSQTVAQASMVDVNVENGIKDTYTFNSSHNPQFITPVTRAITGKIDVVFTSLDDATWGYFSQMESGTSGSLVITAQHPATSNELQFTMPNVRIAKDTQAVKMDDIIVESIEYTAFLNLSTLQTISAVITSSDYLPF